ncbi:MAG: hypothetical protein PVH61_30660 [Candidatus Aminicenantes bacterium]|jgi:hypothetical protein
MESEELKIEPKQQNRPADVVDYNREEIKILEELERMEEPRFYQWFVYRLQSLEDSSAPRSVSAPWELIIWAYKKTMEEELRIMINRCADRLLTNILTRKPNVVNAAETYHLSLIISHLQVRQLRQKLRQLLDRKSTFSLEYDGIDVREQMLYHLESLGYIDIEFWKKEIEDSRFVGAAFLAMTRIGQEQALLYLPHLIEASKEPNGIPLKVILRIALERPGMEGFCQKIIDLFSNIEDMPNEDELPLILKGMNKISREKYWGVYGDLTSKALKQLGIEMKPSDPPNYEIKYQVARARINPPLGIVVYERLECSAAHE